MLKRTIANIYKHFIRRPSVRRRPSSGIIFLHFRMHILNKGTDRVRGRRDKGPEGLRGSGGGRRRAERRGGEHDVNKTKDWK